MHEPGRRKRTLSGKSHQDKTRRNTRAGKGTRAPSGRRFLRPGRGVLQTPERTQASGRGDAQGTEGAESTGPTDRSSPSSPVAGARAVRAEMAPVTQQRANTRTGANDTGTILAAPAWAAGSGCPEMSGPWALEDSTHRVGPTCENQVHLVRM